MIVFCIWLDPLLGSTRVANMADLITNLTCRTFFLLITVNRHQYKKFKMREKEIGAKLSQAIRDLTSDSTKQISRNKFQTPTFLWLLISKSIPRNLPYRFWSNIFLTFIDIPKAGFYAIQSILIYHIEYLRMFQ